MKKHLLLFIIITSTIFTFADTLELYKNCAGCHGENGEKQALNKSKLIGGQETNLTIKELIAYKNGELDQYGLGNIMKLQVSILSKSDIKKLAEYISKLDANASKEKH